jgi:Reverse transcriptase (RNA-dependent DNA polymerase)
LIFIPKPGRESYELAKSFRPISLTLFLLEMLERLVEQSIRDGPLKKYSLQESQHAYQKGKSAETALHDLVSRVEGALKQKIFAMGSFLDMEGAFYNTSFQAMNMGCGGHGVNPTSTRWIDALLGQMDRELLRRLLEEKV